MKKVTVHFEGGRFHGIYQAGDPFSEDCDPLAMASIAGIAYQYASECGGIGTKFIVGDPNYFRLAAQPGGREEAVRKGVNKAYKYEVTDYRAEGDVACVTCKFVEELPSKK